MRVPDHPGSPDHGLKHGHADAARVTLRHTPTALGLEISDNGRGVPQGYDAGRGLLGIGERVALFGGSVTHGGGEGRVPAAGRAPAGMSGPDLAHPSASITVLLADDDALMRAGVTVVLDSADGIEVVGQAADGLQVVQDCRALAPDVVLMDVRPRCEPRR